jgi:hypothetical protein
LPNGRSIVLAVVLMAGCRVEGRPASTDGAPKEASCGGIAGLQCPPNTYCAYTPNQKCGAGDQMSVCKPRPEVCTEELRPVCGCDGKDYGNACTASRAGTSLLKEGTCK